MPAQLSRPAPHAGRLALVEDAFRTLADRYLGAERGFDATYHVRLGDVGHTWEVRCTEHGARVRKGVSSRRPDVTIGTDATTWLRLRQGDLSGIEAFSQRLLSARGQLDLALGCTSAATSAASATCPRRAACCWSATPRAAT